MAAKASPPVLPEELFQEANLGNLKSSYFLQGISGTQWTGLIIFAGLVFILLLCLGFVAFHWTAPPLPAIPATATAEQAKQIVANYQTLCDASRADLFKFMTATVGAIVPLLGTVIGYILGNQAKSAESG